jgi:hypothetical protein
MIIDGPGFCKAPNKSIQTGVQAGPFILRFGTQGGTQESVDTIDRDRKIRRLPETGASCVDSRYRVTGGNPLNLDQERPAGIPRVHLGGMLDIGTHDPAFFIIVFWKLNAGIRNHSPAKLPQGNGAQAGKPRRVYIFSLVDRAVKKA